MKVDKEKTIFMAGVGGMGMCPLAIYLSENGYQVYGYDDNLQPPVANLLKKNNIEVPKIFLHSVFIVRFKQR